MNDEEMGKILERVARGMRRVDAAVEAAEAALVAARQAKEEVDRIIGDMIDPKIPPAYNGYPSPWVSQEEYEREWLNRTLACPHVVPSSGSLPFNRCISCPGFPERNPDGRCPNCGQY